MEKKIQTDSNKKKKVRRKTEHRKDRGEMRRKQRKKIISLPAPRRTNVFCCTEYSNI